MRGLSDFLTHSPMFLSFFVLQLHSASQIAIALPFIRLHLYQQQPPRSLQRLPDSFHRYRATTICHFSATAELSDRLQKEAVIK